MKSVGINNQPRKTLSVNKFVFLVAGIVLLAAVIFLAPKFEWKAPQITVAPDTDTLGLGSMEIAVTERGTGLKSITVVLHADGKEHTLAAEQYDSPVMEKKITVALSSKLAGVKEGPAIVRVRARDRSWWSFFSGNESLIQKNVTIDITPPTLELLADDPYINFGGSGMIVYKASPDTAQSGVKIGKYFFPGYKGQTQDPAAYLAFFAHPYNVAEDEKAFLVAMDKAGNTRQLRLSYTLKNVKYKKSTIAVTDSFIQEKVAMLLDDVGARQGNPRNVFLKVNRELRKLNEEKIWSVTRKSANSMLWSGPFSQLSNSKVEANFADARTYVYNGETIDNAYHVGFDLSVTKRYPVEAANSGVVAFVGDLGIYGNTIIIDHGLGLFTSYSHLSSADVKVGDEIKKAQILGKTGETGLAVGDHLHFETILHGVPVLPLEWWDEKWIKDNVTAKLAPSSGAVAEDAKSPRVVKQTRKRRR
ncbi:MAG TPA: M23 family metallopeptidase [Candidatus Binatia bacterium]|nr:M23 family metallopeptidase [Candidatus Binatia bacterium]